MWDMKNNDYQCCSYANMLLENIPASLEALKIITFCFSLSDETSDVITSEHDIKYIQWATHFKYGTRPSDERAITLEIELRTWGGDKTNLKEKKKHLGKTKIQTIII